MIALLRYQAAILLRSHRWIFPVIAYALLLSVGGGSSEPLADGLDWSAAMLVPVVALLTRSTLTAEPGAARACVAAAAGPARAQLAALLTAIGGGAVLALAGACYEVLTDKVAAADRPAILWAGLGTAVVCMLVGSAVGTLCNPPLLRHPAASLLGTVAAVVLALASDASPASAALRGSGAAVQSPAWPSGVPLLAAVVLLAISWTASALAAAHRAA